MHYEDDFQKENHILKIVVYKHGTGEQIKNKKGFLKKDSVHYELASIQECYLFPPKLLVKLINKPYKFFNRILSDMPYENWYELIIKSIFTDNTYKFDIKVKDVSDGSDELKLH